MRWILIRLLLRLLREDDRFPMIVRQGPLYDRWILVDLYGNVWRLTRTDDPHSPLTITLLQRR